MPKIDKADRRDQQREKRKNGMRVNGKDIALLLRAQEKRDKEAREKHERKDDDGTG